MADKIPKVISNATVIKVLAKVFAFQAIEINLLRSHAGISDANWKALKTEAFKKTYAKQRSFYEDRLTGAFANYGWCAAIRGVEGGGLVEGLPTHTFTTDSGDVALKCPTEAPITDRREKELADLGFIPLVHCKGTDYAAYFSVQSCQKAKMYDKEAANASARGRAYVTEHHSKQVRLQKTLEVYARCYRRRIYGDPHHVA